VNVSFTRLIPSRELAAHVDNFWFLSGEDSSAMPEGHRIFPDGSMEFVFQLGEPFRERQPQGTWRLQDRFLLVGQLRRPVDLRPSGLIDTAGIHFHPAGASAFVEGDLSRFENHIIPLEAALEVSLRPLARKLRAAATLPQKAAVLEDFLRRRRRPTDDAIARAVATLSRASGPIDLAALARHLHLSERQFRRRFEASVGLPPKRFSRLLRFQSVFESRRSNDARAWSQVALDCGYFDQAHFNRDFRAFTGSRPRDIVKNPDPLTEFFLSVSSKTRPPRAR
jgi:AraC-like DNA-binding protein